MSSACILLITNDAPAAQAVRERLSASDSHCKVHVLRDLGMAKARIAGGGVDAVLATVTRDGRTGPRALALAGLCGPGNPPVIALTAAGDDAAGEEAVRGGALAFVALQRLGDLSGILDAAIRRVSPRRGAGRIVSMIGAKGGVGTTTIALNLAAWYARDRDAALLEPRPPVGTLLPYLRPRQATVNLTDLMTDGSKYERPEALLGALWSPPGVKRLRILFAPSGSAGPFEPQAERAQAAAEQLSHVSDCIFIDLGPPSSAASLKVVGASDLLILVIERDSLCVDMAKLLLEHIRKSGAMPASIAVAVVNRNVLPCPLPIADVEAALDLPIAGFLPPAPEVCVAAQNSRSPVILHSPDSLLAESLQRLAGNLSI